MKTPVPLDLPPTSWSLLQAAVGQGPDAMAARDTFVRRYYEPVYAYFIALAGTAERAEDLTQSFFATRILAGPMLPRADRSLGSFRCYLKRTARNFFLDAMRRERRIRHGGDAVRVPIEEAGQLADPDADAQPERMFHSAWVRALLRAALTTVGEACVTHGQAPHFEIFARRYLSEEDPTPSWDALGEAHGLDGKAARGRAETVARRFRHVLRGLLSVELASAQAVDEELVILQMLMSGGDR